MMHRCSGGGAGRWFVWWGIGVRMLVAIELGVIAGCAQEIGESTASTSRGAQVREESIDARLERDARESETGGMHSDAPSALQAAFVRARQREGVSDAGFHVGRERETLVARNLPRRVTGRFSSGGMDLASDDGVQGRLQTTALRCDDVEAPAGDAKFVLAVAPNRVERRIGHGELSATEWIENGPLGIEQGFDVEARACEQLVIELAVDGLVVEAAGDAVRLVGDEGAIEYAQLFALDASGRSLPAHIVSAERGFELVVDSHDAVWPIMVDPLVYADEQVAIPDGPGRDGAWNDQLGYSVAVDGDVAVVGAPFDDVGVRIDAGSAYVFRRIDGVWSLEDKLTANDYAEADAFGISVAISGATVLIGARGDDEGSSTDSGSAYVFHRTGTVWVQEAKLRAGDGAAYDGFGGSVSVSYGTAVVGAKSDADAGPRSGSAYVFVRTATGWMQQAKLVAADASEGDEFGHVVAISGDSVLVGAPRDDDAGADSGSGYVFVRAGTAWNQQAKVVAGDAQPGDWFGIGAAISGDTALLGASGDDDVGSFGGSAYVFVRSGSVWSEQEKLLALDGEADDYFGSNVALSGDRALVGAHGSGNIRGTTGAAYSFVRSGTTWNQTAKVVSVDAAANDNFGWGVALSGTTALIGAYADDDAGSSSGSAYTFDTSSWAQDAKLVAGDGARWGEFGRSVAIFGETAVIGAPRDAQGDLSDAGSAYVFVRSGGRWGFQTKLTAPDGAVGDLFGTSVALFGDTVLVGAYQDDEVGRDRGSAYVFVRSGTTWTLQAKLLSNDGTLGDAFGVSVALLDDLAVVGARADDDAGVDSGSAYVFERSGTTWSQRAKLVAADGAAGDGFGISLALSEDTLLVGALSDDDVGVNGGSAYVFERSGSSWTQQAKLLAADGAANDAFGVSVALSVDTALVGAHQDDDRGTSSGSAYVFVRHGTTWSQQAKIVAADGASGDLFGYRVALSGEMALVGAHQHDDGGTNRGSSYLFARTGTTWAQQTKLMASDGVSDDAFGVAVALFGTTTLIGAPSYAGAPPYGGENGAVYFGTVEDRGALGEPCVAADECASGFCVDGRCCDSACGGGATDDCRACAVSAGAAVDGACGATSGHACDDGFACTVSDSCDVGNCVGVASRCDAATLCSEASGTFVCSACPAGTFSADGTGARACTPCAAGTWSMAGAMVCMAWSECAPGERVAFDGTASSDRTCTVCDAGSYSTSVNATTCTTWTTCEPGERVADAGSSTTDRVCDACPAGTYSITVNATSCTTWSNCAAGSHVASEGSSTSDRTCAGCVGGYTTGTNQLACTPWTTCAPGAYVSSAGSETSDRECMACGVGTYSTDANAMSCAAWTTCPAGTFVASEGSAASDRSCAGCAAGTYSTGANAEACTSWSSCAAGTYVAVMGTAIADRVCSACTTGYTASANQSACSAWTSCAESEFETVPPTATSDRVCAEASACGATRYEVSPPTETMDRVCAPYTECTATQYQSTAPTATSDRECTDLTVCGEGQFESGGPSATSDRVCSDLTVCDATQYESAAPTASSDRGCTALTVCADTEYESRTATATSDRVCSALTVCADTEYESRTATEISDRECATCSTCGEGEVEVEACAATTDTVCAPVDDAGVPMLDGGVDDGGIDDASVDAEASDAGDTPDAGGTSGGGGCGCHTASSGSMPSLGLAVGAAWMLTRRRRRPRRRAAVDDSPRRRGPR